MIVAFDLDDTLYRELDYVESGFRAVSRFLSDEFDVVPDVAFDTMVRSLEARGRGHQFNDVLDEFDLFSAARLRRLVQVYRQHEPSIKLPDESERVLTTLARAGHRLFLVTDGNHHVQARKVSALHLWDRFEHCYLTYRYGRSSSKPSPRVFELILKRTGARPAQFVYTGDNPHKDFIGPRTLGGHTIRVHTGTYARDVVDRDLDATSHVRSISQVPETIRNLEISTNPEAER